MTPVKVWVYNLEGKSKKSLRREYQSYGAAAYKYAQAASLKPKVMRVDVLQNGKIISSFRRGEQHGVATPATLEDNQPKGSTTMATKTKAETKAKAPKVAETTTMKEIAADAGVSYATVLNALQAGKLTAVGEVAGKGPHPTKLISKSSVTDWLAERKAKGLDKPKRSKRFSRATPSSNGKGTLQSSNGQRTQVKGLTAIAYTNAKGERKMAQVRDLEILGSIQSL